MNTVLTLVEITTPPDAPILFTPQVGIPVPGEGVPEAPIDGVSHARKDGAWVAIGSGGGIPEAPADGVARGRKDSTWVPVIETSQPIDGGTFT